MTRVICFLIILLASSFPGVVVAQNPIQRELFCADAGANDTYACSFTVAPVLATGRHYSFSANTVNTGAATVNFNSLGAKTIKSISGGVKRDLYDNELRVGIPNDLIYDGTDMILQSTSGVANNLLQNSQSTAYTTVLADAGKVIYHPGADTTARIWTIDSNANVAYPLTTCITFINDTSAGVVTIAITSDTMILAGAGTTGSRTLAASGIATACKMTSTRWIINGAGLT